MSSARTCSIESPTTPAHARWLHRDRLRWIARQAFTFMSLLPFFFLLWFIVGVRFGRAPRAWPPSSGVGGHAVSFPYPTLPTPHPGVLIAHVCVGAVKAPDSAGRVGGAVMAAWIPTSGVGGQQQTKQDITPGWMHDLNQAEFCWFGLSRGRLAT